MIRIPTNFIKGQDWPVATVRDLLRQVVLGLKDERFVLIVDALDECDEDEVRDMVHFIDGLACCVESLDTCFASRHYPNITIRHCEELVLENSDAHERDILN